MSPTFTVTFKLLSNKFMNSSNKLTLSKSPVHIVIKSSILPSKIKYLVKNCRQCVYYSIIYWLN